MNRRFYQTFSAAVILGASLMILTGCGGITGKAASQSNTPGAVVVSAAALNFGSVTVGSTKTLSDSVTNNTAAGVTISSVQGLASGFQITGVTMPLTLAAGQSAAFSIQFKPTSSGTPAVSISFRDSTGQSVASFSATGTGTTTATAGAMAVSLSSLAFGNVQTNTSRNLSETLTNTGSTSVTISQATATGTGFSISGLTIPTTLGAGQSITFTATFHPLSAGAASGTLAVVSDASNSPVDVRLSGTGTALGQLAASPSTLSFGSVGVGSGSTLSGTLSASGTSVTVTSATLNNGEFVISGISLPTTIAAGKSTPFSVTFTPNASGATSASLSFVSNAWNSAVETMTGSGTSGTQHSVDLSWGTSSGAVGYNVYRGTVSGGPYSKINASIDASATYVDSTVVSGQTYYYVATALDGSSNESGYSNQVQAVIPTP